MMPSNNVARGKIHSRYIMANFKIIFFFIIINFSLTLLTFLTLLTDLVWPLNALNDGFTNAYAGYASRTSYPGYTAYGYTPYAGNYSFNHLYHIKTTYIKRKLALQLQIKRGIYHHD